MKVLLLSCRTGEGHNSAARALEESLTARGVETVLADPVTFQSERASRFVAGFYNGLVKKTPAAFGALYKAGGLYSSTNITSPVYLANALYANELGQYINEQRFDTVVCTHLYGMEALTALHKRGRLTVPTYGVLTDYTCIPFFAETRLTAYFSPHYEIGQQLVNRGIPHSRIYNTGIPVSRRFWDPLTREEARVTLGIAQDKRVILVMAGGVGCENILRLCAELTRRETASVSAYVFAGKNTVLLQKLNRRYNRSVCLHPLGFTDQVFRYMRAADVLISKPGGLSSTEAAASAMPLVHVYAIPGCETCNARFFASHGMSLNAKNGREAVRMALDLAGNSAKAERMRSRQRAVLPLHAADTIAEIICHGE